MKNILTYKGYITKIEYSSEDKVLYGKVEGIKDLINFESDDANTIEEEFHKAVDDYLDLCSELGQNPDKTYGGTFNVRIPPELHKNLAYLAASQNRTLNSAVEEAIKKYISSTSAR